MRIKEQLKKHFRDKKMANIHHQHLPSFSTLLSGPAPRNALGFRSNHLQISYFNTNEAWSDPLPHAHQASDECYLVLRGSLVLEAEGEQITLGPREFCCFPSGTYHQVVQVNPPIECLILRGPSVADKSYLRQDGAIITGQDRDIFRMLDADGAR
jgi:mannose-6-phosphate isomerase-like protein (cupin superfamily)